MLLHLFVLIVSVYNDDCLIFLNTISSELKSGDILAHSSIYMSASYEELGKSWKK